jgi:FkbM family methyltransferase
MNTVLSHGDTTPTGTKVVWNVAFGAFRVLLVAPVPLLITPFIIKHVGTQGLGLWALFLSFNGLTSLADLGFQGTLTKHVSEHSAKQDYEQLNRVINAGLLIFVAVALFAVVLLNLGSGFLVGALFRQGSFPATQLRHAFQLLSLAVGLNLLAFPFMSIITGLQELGLSNLIATVNSIAMAVLVALFLAFSFGISGLVYAILFSATLNLALSVAIAKLLFPRFRVSLRSIQIVDISGLCAFSFKMYVVQVAVLIHNHIEKFLLAYFSGLTSTGMYAVANDLSLKSRGIPSLLLSPLLPAASELEARGEQLKTLQLYQRSQKYLAMVGVLMVVITSLLAHRFVNVWLGQRFAPVATALIVLTVMQLVNLTTGPGFFISIGKGNLWPSVYLAVMGIVLNIILSTILIRRFGFAGAVIGTAISLSIASLSFVAVFHKEMSYPASLILEPYAKPLAWGVVLALVARLILPINHLSWAGMINTAVIVAVAYIAGLVVLHYFDAFDLHIARQVLMIPLFSLPVRAITKVSSMYSGPPLHRIVRSPLSYLWWRTGLSGHAPKTVSLVTGERIIMRYPNNDWYTAAEIFLEGEYAAPFHIPSDLRTIHDLGANVGYATVFLANRFPQSHVDVFEPHPDHLLQLDLNIALNALQSRTTVHPYAVGAECRELFLTNSNTCSTLIGQKENGAVTVKVTDWLDFARRCEIDLLKMDIEGGEYEIVFDPRFDTLRIPYICMEWHVHSGTSRPDVAERLRTLGYTVYAGPERRLPDSGLRYGMIWARLENKASRPFNSDSPLSGDTNVI